MTSARLRVPPPAPPDRLLSVEEAAALLSVTRGGLYALTARRQIPYRKRGKRLVFLASEISAYIAALEGLTLAQWEQGRPCTGRRDG